MKIPYAAVPRLRLTVLLAFVTACVLMFAYLWVNMGGTIPVVSKDGYRVQVDIADVDNAVFDSDVRIAGVPVGKVRGINVEDGVAKVDIQIDNEDVAPFHEGVTVHLRAKSLIEETYLDIIDGKGAAIPDGGSLPASAVAEPVQLHDVLTGLDKPTRDALGSSLRELGVATEGRRENVAQTMAGLGDLGLQGHDVIDALAAQSEDLDDLVRSTGTVVRTLDERNGEIVDLVEQANRLTKATADNQKYLESTMKKLPGVLGTANAAAKDLGTLGSDLAPIATSLRQAAPDLNAALTQLPASTKDLRALLPSLNKVLDRSPATLQRTPKFSSNLSAIVPDARTALADLNPMLGYLAPYHRDLTAFFTNWAAMMSNSDANGRYLRILLVINEQSIKGLPIDTNFGPLDKRNAYPPAGGALTPGPFTGNYPRVEEAKP